MDFLKIGKATEIENKKDRATYRSFEILPGLLSWSSIGVLTLLSFSNPFFVAAFIIAFDLYWIIRITYFYSHLAAAFSMMRKIKKVNWLEKLKELNPHTITSKGLKTKSRSDNHSFGVGVNWEEIHHLIVLPFVKEGREVIRPTIEALVSSNYPVKEKMIVVLASEARAGEEAQKIAQEIKNEYEGRFFKFLTTTHPKDIPGEIVGKGANTAWAGRKAKELIDQLNISYENIIVSSFDIDTVVPPDYFSRLTYVYLTTEDRLRASYQPVPLYFNNIWGAPFLSRIAAFSTTFWALLNQERPNRLKTFSSHSMPFKALVDVDFWKPNIVNEDNIIFLQCFFKYNGNYRVVPLYYPVYMDANVGKNFRQTAGNIYKQHRRWGWGAETIPFILFGSLKNRLVPFRKKLILGLDYLEGFWSWATNSFIIAIFGWLPLAVGGIEFKKSILALNLPAITGGIGNFALIALIFSAFYSINLLLLKMENRAGFKKQFFWMALQWILTPLVMIILITTPALDAQTRLMFGKYMGFWVTPKHRRNPETA